MPPLPNLFRTSRPGQPRHHELDALRGAAVLMMVTFHFLYDIQYFTGAGPADVDSGFWFWFGRATAILFLLLMGTSLTLLRSRLGPDTGPGPYLRRGTKIFAWGLLITLVTRATFPENTIWFGVLHLIGASTLLAPLLLRLGRRSLPLGALLIALGVLLYPMTFPFPHLLWLGLTPAHTYAFDYFPLLPWLGVVMVGIALGETLYPGGQRRIPMPNRHPRLLCTLGQNSLLIYLLHQPILAGLLLLLLHPGLTPG